MELWIRSQDKTILVKAKNIIIDKNDFSLYQQVNENIQIVFGMYKTKERALEILDEIQRIIMEKELADYKTYVYEMPEE